METTIGAESMLLEALKKMQIAAIEEISLKPDRKAVVLKEFQQAFTKMVAANYLFLATMVEAPERFMFDGLMIATQLGRAFGIQGRSDSLEQATRLSVSLEQYVNDFDEPLIESWVREHIDYYKRAHKEAMDSLYNKVSEAFDDIPEI
jgi:hypothetical protein